ncbi:MAG: O-antigen polymerase [Lachnospiraceae bacterium]|jgi:oligosaccharide repeat unit polymerase
MTWLCSLFFLILAYFGKLIKRRWSNLLTVFAGFFGVTLFLANFRWYGIYSASEEALLIMFVGVVLFFLGYIIVCAIGQTKKKQISLGTFIEINEINDTHTLRINIVKVMLIFALAYSIFRLYVLFALLRSGYEYIQIRTIYFNSKEMFEGILGSIYGRNRLDVYLFQPTLLALTIISSITFFTNALNFTQKQKVRFVMLVFICTAFTAISDGGREKLYYFIMIFAFCFFIVRRKQIMRGRGKLYLSKRQKRIIRVVAVVAVIAMVVITFRRYSTGGGSIQRLLRTVYIYFTGYIPHFSIRLNELHDTDYTYGYSFILGLIKLPAAILHRVFGVPTSNAFSVAEASTSNLQFRVDIGGGTSFNAYVGPFYYFFADLGYVSLIIESFLFGAICAGTEQRYKADPSCLNLFMLLFCFYLIITSMVRWEMIHPKTAMMVYFIPLLFKKNCRKGNFG